MANTQKNSTQQTTWFPPDPNADPDIVAQIAGDETQPGQLSVPHLVPQSFTEYMADPVNVAKVPQPVPDKTPLPSLVANAITSDAAPSLFPSQILTPPAAAKPVQPLAGPPRQTLEDALFTAPTLTQTSTAPAPTRAEPGTPAPPSFHIPTRDEILASRPPVIAGPPRTPRGWGLAANGIFAAMDNIGAAFTGGTPVVGPGLVKNAQALAEYNRTLPLIRQEAENKQVDDITRQMDTASQIGLRNAQTYQITHPAKPNAAEPLFDKAGGLIGFRDASGNMLSPNSPNLTQDMREIYQLAQDKPIKAQTPEAQTFDFMVKQGKTPMEAFQAIESAKQAGKGESGAAEDARYEKIIASQKQGQPVTPADAAWAGAYEKRKTLAPVATATLQQPNKDNDRLDRSYTYNDNKLDKLASPIEEKQQRLSTLLGNVNLNSAAADSVIAPELLTVMAGGQGSGVRMTDAEIRRITSGRSSMQDMKALLQKVAGGGQSFTDNQRAQIRQMVDLVQSKIQRKLQIISDARDQMLDATSVQGHRAVISHAQRGLDSIDAGDIAQAQSAGAPTGMITVQIPGQPVGHIPASARKQFLQDNPGAKVIE